MENEKERWIVERKAVSDTAFQSREDKQAIVLIDFNKNTDKEKNSKILQLLSDFLLRNHEKIQSADKNSISYNFLLQLERMFCKKELPKTVIGITLDVKKKNYCVIHLGNGAAAVQGEDQKIYLLSKPCREKRAKNSLSCVKIQKGCLKNMSGFLLVSDDYFQNYFDIKKYEDVFHKNSDDAILDKEEDEQSYIKNLCSKSDR